MLFRFSLKVTALGPTPILTIPYLSWEAFISLQNGGVTQSPKRGKLTRSGRKPGILPGTDMNLFEHVNDFAAGHGAHFPHDVLEVVFHYVFTDEEPRSYILVRKSLGNERHNFDLAI